MDEQEPSTHNHKSPLPWRSQKRIQRLAECHHFHYPAVEIGAVLLDDVRVRRLYDGTTVCQIGITSNGTTWQIQRSLLEFVDFDRQLHRCVFERRHSRLEELEFHENMPENEVKSIMSRYAERLSQLTGSLITCYPVLKFLEVDCRGNHFEPAEETAINTPAIAAAVVTKDFEPKQDNHLRLKVGDIVSIIEMASTSQNETTYWKAKLTISAARKRNSIMPEGGRGFEVGYFPSDCVCLIDDKRLPSPLSTHKRASLPTARRMTELLRNRVRRREPIFGMDLTQHLEKSGRQVPLLLEKCCEAIENLGIVTGIYRQCGIQSNIQRLRAKYDSGHEPDLFEFGQRDIYSVSSLLKQYFRQLPNPLFTFEAYSNIVSAFDGPENEREVNLKRVMETLPIGHFRTARYLMNHLNRLCKHTNLTDMTAKNLAIVWAPNLFRSPSMINGCDSHLLSGLNVHTALCNYLISNAKEVFGDDDNASTADQSSYLERDPSLEFIQPNMITKSATMSDMRSHESRWPRFLRGRSVEGFWKFHRRSQMSHHGGMNSSISDDAPVKWRRSHSTDASLHNSRTDSIFSLMSRGMDEIRGGVRNLRERARSLRPSPRPQQSSPNVLLRHFSQMPSSPGPVIRTDQPSNGHITDSITASTVTQYSEDVSFTNKNFLTPQSTRKDSSSGDKSSASESISIRTPVELKERRVMFKNEEDIMVDEDDTESTEVRPLCERSSPVEEWSSDSRDSPLLEMSRYDNVSPSGTLNRGNRDKISRDLSTPVSLYEQTVQKSMFLM